VRACAERDLLRRPRRDPSQLLFHALADLWSSAHGKVVPSAIVALSGLGPSKNNLPGQDPSRMGIVGLEGVGPRFMSVQVLALSPDAWQ
jgi:hypothetical protein